MADNKTGSNIRSIDFYRRLKRSKESGVPALVSRDGKIAPLVPIPAKGNSQRLEGEQMDRDKSKGEDLSMSLFIEVVDEFGNEHVINRATILSLTRAEAGKTLIKYGFAGDAYLVMAMTSYDKLRDDVTDMN